MLRTLLLAAATANLALSQSIDFNEVNSAPTPTKLGPALTVASEVPTYKTSAADASASAAASADPISSNDKKRSIEKRANVVVRNACDPQPTGAAPTTSPDTASDFLANTAYDDIQSSAPVPQGYQLVFENLQGSTQQAGYLGYYTLQKYDTIQCQQFCDATSTCTAFNVYIERDPSVEPGSGCSNPASTVNYKCSLYGLPVSNTTATNTGQYVDQFQVVITASNGYVKNPAPPSYTSFSGPNSLGGAINAPITSCGSSYIGVYFAPGPYDPSQCAAACTSTTQYDHDHLVDQYDSYDACNFFVSYVLSKNNEPLGTYCALYSRGWSSKYATNTGQYDSDGNYYSVSSAYSYYLTQQDPGYLILP